MDEAAVEVELEFREDDDDWVVVVVIMEALKLDNVEEYEVELEDTEGLLVLDDEMIFFAWAEMDFRLTRRPATNWFCLTSFVL